MVKLPGGFPGAAVGDLSPVVLIDLNCRRPDTGVGCRQAYGEGVARDPGGVIVRYLQT
jgi:hypothetical protein